MYFKMNIMAYIRYPAELLSPFVIFIFQIQLNLLIPTFHTFNYRIPPLHKCDLLPNLTGFNILFFQQDLLVKLDQFVA